MTIYDTHPDDVLLPAAGLLPLAAPLAALYGAYALARDAAHQAEHTYTRAEAATRRVRQAVQIGTAPVTALAAAKRVEDAAWDTWGVLESRASQTWWAWQRAWIAWERATACGFAFPSIIAPAAAVRTNSGGLL